jgi:hypothetical protein
LKHISKGGNGLKGGYCCAKIRFIRVASPDNIKNGFMIQREVTAEFKIESVRVMFPDNIANGVKVQKVCYFYSQN